MKRRRATSRRPAKAQQTTKAKRGTTSKPARNRRLSESKDAEVARLARELAESLQQQTATSQVLRVISSSPGELKPVFASILANATQICEAKFANLALVEGGELRMVAMHGAPPAFEDLRLPKPPESLDKIGLFRRTATVPASRGL